MIATEHVKCQRVAFLSDLIHLGKLLVGKAEEARVGVRNNEEILVCLRIAQSGDEQVIKSFCHMLLLQLHLAHVELEVVVNILKDGIHLFLVVLLFFIILFLLVTFLFLLVVGEVFLVDIVHQCGDNLLRIIAELVGDRGEEGLLILPYLAVGHHHEGEVLEEVHLLVVVIGHSDGDFILVGLFPIIDTMVVLLFGESKFLGNIDEDIFLFVGDVAVGKGYGHQVDEVHHPDLFGVWGLGHSSRYLTFYVAKVRRKNDMCNFISGGRGTSATAGLGL